MQQPSQLTPSLCHSFWSHKVPRQTVIQCSFLPVSSLTPSHALPHPNTTTSSPVTYFHLPPLTVPPHTRRSSCPLSHSPYIIPYPYPSILHDPLILISPYPLLSFLQMLISLLTSSCLLPHTQPLHPSHILTSHPNSSPTQLSLSLHPSSPVTYPPPTLNSSPSHPSPSLHLTLLNYENKLSLTSISLFTSKPRLLLRLKLRVIGGCWGRSNPIGGCSISVDGAYFRC